MIILTRTLVAAALVLTATVTPSGSSGTSEQRAFLEAALFFVTNIEPRQEDTVNDREIIIYRHRIKAYLVDSNPCAVRFSTTTGTYTVWQIDFCEISSYRRLGRYEIQWWGSKTGLCIMFDGGLREMTNYYGPMVASTCGRLKFYDEYYVWSSFKDINDMTGTRLEGDYSHRSVDRMITSFKYIETLLRGKPY
jgi:hypothetical protein